MSSKLNPAPDWLSGIGPQLSGGYELRQLLNADSRSALFRTLLPGDASPRGFTRFFRLEPTAATRQLDLWKAVASLPNQNLVKIIGAGQTQSEAEAAAYVITESADETLAGVLAQRRLTVEETGEVLSSLLQALRQLHAAGFVHGRISPAKILSCEEVVKLSADCATRAGEKTLVYRGLPAYCAPEEGEQNSTPAADIWCLGATLFEALTQKPFASTWLEEARRLPAPFGRIIPDCVDPQPAARPRLADISTLSHAKQAPLQSFDAPPFADGIRRAQPREMGPSYQAERRMPLALMLAAAVIVLGVIAFWWTRQNSGVKATPRGTREEAGVTRMRQPVTAPDSPTPVTPPDAVADAKQLDSTPPPPAATEPAAEPATEPAVSAAKPVGERTERPIWRVILWTYRDPADAQKKANSLAARFPDLHPEAFSPDPDSGLTLVVAGGKMTREQAAATRAKVRQLGGMPRDSYIQNYSH